MSDELARLDRESLWHPLLQHRGSAAPRCIERGAGSYVYDTDGKRWLDGVSGLWCVNVGHGRSELADVARDQMAKLAYTPLTLSHEPAIRLAAKLVEKLGYPSKVYFSNSGSEANENAFKIARQYHAQRGAPGRTKFISRYRGYHGTTLGGLSATGQAERRLGYEPLVPGFVFTEAPDIYRGGPDAAEALENTILREGAESVAAFIMEPIIAGGGVVLPPEDYLPRVREICSRHGVLLIVDEVVTGFCRTGTFFAHTRAGVQPDILTLAKGIASGYMPLGATIATDEVFSAFEGEAGDLSHFRSVNTFGGHPVATAVALRNIEILEREDLAARAESAGRHLLERLSGVAGHPNVGDVRGRGLLIGIEIVDDRATKQPASPATLAAIAQACGERGVIVGKTTNGTPGMGNVLILAPPLTLSEAEADELVAAVEHGIHKVLPASTDGGNAPA